jgi:hypothetical protein
MWAEFPEKKAGSGHCQVAIKTTPGAWWRIALVE